MKTFPLMLMILATFAMTACNTTEGRGNKEIFGGLGGAAVGGLLGSQVGSGSGQNVAIGAGVLLGALLGSEIGSSLDNADRAAAQLATQKAYTAPVGETISWNNPDSGNRGTVTPVRDGYSSGGRYCREYQQTITVGGREETAFGTACQTPNGDWEVVS